MCASLRGGGGVGLAALDIFGGRSKSACQHTCSKKGGVCLGQLDVIWEWIRAPRLHNKHTAVHEPVLSGPTTFTPAATFSTSTLLVEWWLGQKTFSTFMSWLHYNSENCTIQGKSAGPKNIPVINKTDTWLRQSPGKNTKLPYASMIVVNTFIL